MSGGYDFLDKLTLAERHANLRKQFEHDQAADAAHIRNLENENAGLRAQVSELRDALRDALRAGLDAVEKS